MSKRKQVQKNEEGKAVEKRLACGLSESVVSGSIPGRDELGFFGHCRVV